MISDHLIETLAEAVHVDWMEQKLRESVTTRLATWGEELVTPYANLSERAKDLDRNSVRAVVRAIARVGGVIAIPEGRP